LLINSVPSFIKAIPSWPAYEHLSAGPSIYDTALIVNFNYCVSLAAITKMNQMGCFAIPDGLNSFSIVLPLIDFKSIRKRGFSPSVFVESEMNILLFAYHNLHRVNLQTKRSELVELS
jgi:hypothetical protein